MENRAGGVPRVQLAFGFCLLLAYTLVGCGTEPDSEKPAPGRSWINPITGVHVVMPPGWRSSPAHARKGAKSIGFFKPKPQQVLASAYTHVSLHFEEVAGDSGMSLDAFAGNFAAVLQSWDGEVGAVKKGREGPWAWARLQARVPLKGREPQRLLARIWTADQSSFWYAVVEAPWGDSLTVTQAEPLLELLQGTFSAKDESGQ